MGKPRLKASDYIQGISEGKRYLLSQAITLVESTREDDQQLAEEVLESLIGHGKSSLRIGITGVPGVGKSTFINALGPYLIRQGHRVAVLSIDPSSQLSRGSILGDKTRMPELSQQSEAYIRPSAAGDTLGGVARKTRESMLLCEAAGYDIILIETVGVGQSETLVHQMVDCFLLLMLAGAGDELQGIKRGIMEMSDVLVINKADGSNLEATRKARQEYQNALHLFPTPESGVLPEVLTCSSVEKVGLDTVWRAVDVYHQKTKANGFFTKNRQQQRLNWFHDTLRQYLQQLFFQHPGIRKELEVMEQQVLKGQAAPGRVARKLINQFQQRT